MIAVLGFAGLTVRDGEIALDPHLPDQITEIKFPITLRGRDYLVTVTHEAHTIKEIGQ